MKVRWGNVLALLLMASLVTLIVVSLAGPAHATAEHVGICHRTGSSVNPYVFIQPSAAGVYHGHLPPNGHTQVGNGLAGDIIPPFTYQGQTYTWNYLNWPLGQEIFEGQGGVHCVLPAPPTVTPSPTPHHPHGHGTTITPPSGTAYTGSEDAVIGISLTIALLVIGTSFLWLSRRRRRSLES